MVLAGMWFGAVIKDDIFLFRFVPKMDILGPTQGEMKPPELLLLFTGINLYSGATVCQMCAEDVNC